VFNHFARSITGADIGIKSAWRRFPRFSVIIPASAWSFSQPAERQ